MDIIPEELTKFFNKSHFKNYPYLAVPQYFHDDRGEIKNLADGAIGDVSIITSKKGAIRAEHLHLEDWHLTFLIDGLVKVKYAKIEDGKARSTSEFEIKPGDLIFTPKKTWHKFEFSADSTMVVISRLSRLKTEYEMDTLRIKEF